MNNSNRWFTAVAAASGPGIPARDRPRRRIRADGVLWLDVGAEALADGAEVLICTNDGTRHIATARELRRVGLIDGGTKQ